MYDTPVSQHFHACLDHDDGRRINVVIHRALETGEVPSRLHRGLKILTSDKL